jgi:hypothetical protein
MAAVLGHSSKHKSKHPNAYTIYGHGYDSIEKFTVPPGCMILAHVGPAIMQKGNNYVKILQILQTLQTQQSDITYHPLPYMNDIIDKLRTNNLPPFAVYLPGEKCPNFIYDPVLYFPKLHRNGLTGHCGIKCINDTVFIPNLSMDPVTIQQDDMKTTYHLLSAYCKKTKPSRVLPRNAVHVTICSQFLNSIHPTIEEIYDMIETTIYGLLYESVYDTNGKLLHPRDDTTPYSDTAEYALDYQENKHTFESTYSREFSQKESTFTELMKILDGDPELQSSQQMLCESYPGIYYNLVCRKRKEIYNEHNRITYNHMRNNITALSTNPVHRKVQTNIIEDKLKRRNYLKQYFTSDTYLSKKLRNTVTYQEMLAQTKQDITNRIDYLQNLGVLTKKSQHDLKQLEDDLKKIKHDEQLLITIYNEYVHPTNIHRHRAHTILNGSYKKSKGKWVRKTKKMQKTKKTHRNTAKK